MHETAIDEDEIDLIELWHTIARYKKFVIFFTISITILSAVWSLAMTNIYKSTSVIIPSGQTASRLGSLASLAGISPHQGAGSTEILALLKSNVLKKEVIDDYHLMPVLFYKSWNKKKNRWKKVSGGGLNLFVANLIAEIRSRIGSSSDSSVKNIKTVPDIDDGISALGKIFDVSENQKLGAIDISIEYPNPAVADSLLNDIITTLKNHMTAEAIRIAKKKNTILKKELLKTADPMIQQVLYKLIAKQMATLTTAKVSENFAFKIIDPPYAPNRKYKPKRKLIVIVAFITSLILGIFIVFFIEFIKNAKDKDRKDNSDNRISADNNKTLAIKEEDL